MKQSGILVRALGIAAFGAGLMGVASVGNGTTDVYALDVYADPFYIGINDLGYQYYVLGITSCNQGDEPLSWFRAPANEHPVIGQNVFQYADGRMLQLGQAWAKHGFASLNKSLCGTCVQPPAEEAQLGVNCSDPYGAETNAMMISLGAKSEVNASTGWIPTHYRLPESEMLNGNGYVFVERPELDPDGVLITEAQYVHYQDAAFGTDENNVSYRVMAGSPPYVQPGAEQAVIGQPAIAAWKAFDADVQLTHIDVPDDGRLYVASKATDLGGGQWRYDYAVQNTTSDRSGGAFHVSIGNGVNVSDVGFRDVLYYSGEIYDETDWASKVGAGGVTWDNGADWRQMPNANALRWGTMYNFWFTADRGPGQGDGQIELFKPGVIRSVSTGVIAPTAGAVVNDTCSGALALSDGAHVFSNTGAVSNSAGVAGCTFSGMSNDVWYAYTPACNGTVTVDTCGTAFDTRLAVYSGSCGALGSPVACNDNACGAASSVSFAGVAGQTYYVRVGSAVSGTTGQGSLNIEGPACLLPPVNDSCDAAQEIHEWRLYQADTRFAANTAGETGPCDGAGGGGVWYRFTPLYETKEYVFSACEGDFEPVFTVYEACNGSVVGCGQDAFTCGQDGAGVPVVLHGGQEYLVRVSSDDGSVGRVEFQVRGAVTNDECVDATPLYDGVDLFGTTEGATNMSGLSQSCFPSRASPDVWYSYAPAVSETVALSTCSSYTPGQYVMEVYQSCGGAAIACHDGGFALGNPIQCDRSSMNQYPTYLELQMMAGQKYLIRLSEYQSVDDAENFFRLTVTGGQGQPPEPECLCDFNFSSSVDFFDLLDFLDAWFDQAIAADFNGSGTVDFFDLLDFLDCWFDGCE